MLPSQILCLLSATALWVGGALLRPPSQTLATTGRHLVRPLVLPILWRGLEQTEQQGSVAEYVARGQVLMRFVPEWSTGHIHLANRLSYDRGPIDSSPEAGVGRLWEAIQLLEAALVRHPAGAEAYLTAMVNILVVQCSGRPRLAKAFAERLGNPFQLAESYMRRIPRLRDSRFLQDEIPFLVIRGIPHDIRLAGADWRQVGIRNTAAAATLLRRHRRPEIATPWLQSLAKLDSYLRGNDDISLGDLATDPRLAKIVGALRSRVR